MQTNTSPLVTDSLEPSKDSLIVILVNEQVHQMYYISNTGLEVYTSLNVHISNNLQTRLARISIFVVVGRNRGVLHQKKSLSKLGVENLAPIANGEASG